MPVTAGPIYPGVKDGLVFAIDPANPDSWTGPTSDTVDSLVPYTPVSCSILNNTSGSFGVSSSFAFDGVNDEIVLESSIKDYFGPTNAYAGDVSLSLWFRRASTGPTLQMLFHYGNFNFSAASVIGAILYPVSDGEHEIRISFLYGQRLTHAVSYDNDFHHLTAVVENNGSGNYATTLYYDGDQVATSTSTGLSSELPSNIGCQIGQNYTYDLNGNMGPILLYNRALTASEVKQNYNQLKGRFGL